MNPRFLSARSILRTLIIIVILGFAMHLLLPQIGEVREGMIAFRQGRWPFLGITFIGLALTYFADAWMIRSSVKNSPPWTQIILIEIAGFFASAVTPASLGWVIINQQYLEHYGNDSKSARTGITLFILLTITVYTTMLLIMLLLLPSLKIPKVHLPATFVILEIGACLLAAIGIALWIPASRRKILEETYPVFNAFPEVFRYPKRTAVMVLASVTSYFAYGISLAGAIAAFGHTLPFIGILLAYCIAVSVSTMSPTPGGLGAMEMTLTTILSWLGLPAGSAIASVLTFRLITFWIPIPLGGWTLHYVIKRGWIFKP
ncbi:MAG TPA: YbhN family protein [Chitinispirillaceae bacterium]|nr:YbhN family protein [Chitinispirillaceae bacterium]